MFTNILQRRITNKRLQFYLFGQFSKISQQQTYKIAQSFSQSNTQKAKEPSNIQETSQNQIAKQKSKDNIPPFTIQIQEDVDNDKVVYTDPLNMNMLRRLHIRDNIPEHFKNRASYLSSIYPFFEQHYFVLPNDNYPDDHEYVYDIEKINLKEYMKKIMFQPGIVSDEDFFLRGIITVYSVILLSWFMIDVVIFKIVYGEKEIRGIDKNKRYLKTQLKGQQYEMELEESKSTFPQLENQQKIKIDSILHEVQKQQPQPKQTDK